MKYVPIFERFTAEVLPDGSPALLARKCRRLARPRRLERKQSARLGETEDNLVFVASGTTKLVAGDSAGDEQILSFHFAGDFVSVPCSLQQSCRLVAIRDAELLAFTADDLIKLAREYPALFEVYSNRTVESLHRYQQHLLTIGRRSATERVAGFLMAMTNVSQVAEDSGHVLNLLMTRREIADCLGLTVETVSRQFSKFRELHLIETPSRTKVIVRDLAELARCAGNPAEAGG